MLTNQKFSSVYSQMLTLPIVPDLDISIVSVSNDKLSTIGLSGDTYFTGWGLISNISALPKKTYRCIIYI